MTDADQARHRLHIAPLPPRPATLQAQAQRLRFALHLAAADRAARRQTLRVIHTPRVLREVTDQPVRGPPTAFPFRLLGPAQQLAHPLADARPALANQQVAATLVGDLRLARRLPEKALGTSAEVLTAVEEVERLQAAGQHTADGLPDPTRAVGQGMDARHRRDAEATQTRAPTAAELL